MASLNKVLLMGNLTRAPELRYTPGGSAVCEFGLAMNRKFSTGNGQDKDETCFVDIVVWGKQAENCNRFLDKGAPAFIEGRLSYEQWQDRESGAKRSRLRVVAERVQFLGSRSQDGGDGDYNGGGQQQSYGGNQSYGGGNQSYGGGQQQQSYGQSNQSYGGGQQQYGNQSYGGGQSQKPQPQSYPQEQNRPQQQNQQQPQAQPQTQTGRQQPPPPPMPEGSFDVDNAEDDIPF